MELPTKGTLSEVSFIEILKDASTSGLTGMLRLETGSVIKVVYLQNGTIAFASSNEKADRLTEVLKRAAKLTLEQIEHAQARIKPNVSLGKTLVELGYISPKDLLWGARMQVEGILYQLLFWERGSYQVLEGPLPKEIVSLGLTIPQIIYAGILQTRDRDWILKHIGSPEAVYVLTNSSAEKLDEYRLPVNEIISRMNGKRSLEEIAQATGIDTFEVCKTLAALQILELVQPEQYKPVQMPLLEPKSEDQEPIPVLEETSEKNGDISLGEVLQIPTVEELEHAPPEATPRSHLSPVEDQTEEYTEPVPDLHEEEPPPQQIAEAPAFREAGDFQPVEVQAEPDYEELDEEGGSDRKKIVFIIVLLGLIAAAAAFYFFRKSGPDKRQDTSQLPVETKEPVVTQTENQARVETPIQDPITVTQKSQNTAERIVTASAVELAAAGKLSEAAGMWRRELNRNRNNLTIQIEIACQDRTVIEALSLFGATAPIYVVPLDFKGQPCYRVLYGIYKSEAQAENDRAGLPAEFLQQPSPPKVIPISKALQ